MTASTKSRPRKPTAPSRAAGAFNDSGIDMTGTSPRQAGRFEHSICHTDGCGDAVPAGSRRARPEGSVVLTVVGREGPTWHCSTSCATFAMALADVQALR